MGEWKDLKINTWWKALVYLEVLFLIGGSVYEIKFIESKYLFGEGIGLILIGISNWMALKYRSKFAFGGILNWKERQHSLLTLIIMILGILISVFFMALIIIGLV